ncbi:MAG: hypothetical protein Q7U91_00145 [Sideroxyarcus sp.]|nr:hypothetical protein [Sideroxyarcus sp.]
MLNQTSSHIDMMIHVDDATAKSRLVEQITKCDGVIKPRVVSEKPNLLFVSYDPARFDIRSVPSIARSLGINAQIVEV